MYNVTLYKNTNYNALLIPRTPAVLALQDSITVPSIDIVQDRFLLSIRVAVSWDNVKDCDYALVNDMYYFIDDMHMLSVDTCELSLTWDAILSAGGVDNLEFQGGITERVTPLIANDIYGRYAEHDDYLAPAQPMGLYFDLCDEFANPDSGSSSIVFSEDEFVECTFNPYSSGGGGNAAMIADTYTDPNDPTIKVSVPSLYPNTGNTFFRTGSKDLGTRGTGLYRPDQYVLKGLQRARELSKESSIIAHYSIPRTMYDTSGTSGQYPVSKLVGLDSNNSSLGNGAVDILPFYYVTGTGTSNYNLFPNRIFYSEYNKYGIVSASGDKMEAEPLRLYYKDSNHNTHYNYNDSPDIRIVTDPRPGGYPMYRFKYVDGSDDFMFNCIKGVSWKEIPLRFEGKSGSTLDRMQFNAGSNERYSDYKMNESMAWITGIGAMAHGVGNGVQTGGAVGGVYGAVGGAIVGGASAGIGLYMALDKLEDKYKSTARRELMNYGISQISTPEIQVPYSGDAIRDMFGNTFGCYKYLYSQDDFFRICGILRMYGYKQTHSISKADVTSDPNYDITKFYGRYIRANGVQVSGTTSIRKLPRWWNDAIAAQFSAGIRIIG